MLAYVTLAIVWGSTYNAIRVAVEVFNPFFYSAVRFVSSAVAMLAIAAALGVRFPRGVRPYLGMAASGVLLIFLGNGLLSVAEMKVQSGIASVLSALSPITVALLVYLLPGEERLKPLGWAGVTVGFLGVVALFWDGLAKSEWTGGEGVLLVSGFFWSAGSVVARRSVKEGHPLIVAGVQMLAGGSALAIAFPFWGPPVHSPITALSIGAVVYLAVVGGLIGFGCFAYLLSKVPVARASTFGYINPAVALLIGWLFLGEVFSAHQLAGIGLVLLGVVLVHVAARRRAS